MTRYAREHNWHLVTDMIFTGMWPTNWRGDGVIVLPSHLNSLFGEIRRKGLPCVAFGGTDLPPEISRIEFDNTEIGRIAADHFIDRQHRHFTWAPLLDDDANQERLAAFRQRLAEHHCSCHELSPAYLRIGTLCEDNWIDHRRDLILELQRLPKPNAIFAFNDCVAVNLIEACRDAGLSVPEDIAILGAGNSFACETSPLPLSSIEWDLEDAGYQASIALEQLMNGNPNATQNIRVRAKGIATRVSSDFTAVSDARVARALTYIAENYTNPLLSVNDVASAVGTSRRNLERCFRIETGNTIHEQISRSRMQEASRLLKTHARVRTADVASLVGLAGPGTFSRTFRRYYGMSPQAHRTRTNQAANARCASSSANLGTTKSKQTPAVLAAGSSPSAA
ncbi:MAG TPA: substrate-binding domain-containing protein [Opitutaceae bacterium]